MLKRALVALLAVCASGCSGRLVAVTPPHYAQPIAPPSLPLGGGVVQHVVVIVQENRTFDDLFGGFAGGPRPYPGANAVIPSDVALTSSTFATQAPYNTHDWFRCLQVNDYDAHIWRDYARGRWPSSPHPCPTTAPPANPDVPPHVGREPQALTIVDTRHRAAYEAIAKEFELGDAFYAVEGSDSFPGHQYVVSLASRNDLHEVIAGTPTLPDHSDLASCGLTVLRDDVQTPVLDPATGFTHWRMEGESGVCWGGRTFGDALDAAHVTWTNYNTDPTTGVFDGFINFRAWYPQTQGEGANFKVSLTDFQRDVAAGNLPQFTWLKPPCIALSDHPGTHQDPYGGQDWVADAIDWVGRSPLWKSTVIFVVWDDWGGFYDHAEPPAALARRGLTPGLREPFLVISPWDRTRGGVVHTVGTYASVLRFVEQLDGIAPLNELDANASSLGAYFNFAKTTLPPFRPIRPAERGFDPAAACARYRGTPLAEIDR